MLLRASIKSLTLLSLSLPLFSHAGNIWLFAGTRQPAIEQEKLSVAPQMLTEKSKKEGKSQPCSPKKKWGCEVMVGAGYRHDKLSNRYTPSSTSSLQRVKFKYRDLDSVMALVRVDANYSNFLFSIEGDYSPVVNGTLSAPFNIDSAVNEVFDFRFKKLTGYEADAMASLGYRLQFMNGYKAKAAIILQVGYRYSHQTYEADAQDTIKTPTLISILHDQTPTHNEWFGPFLEARFSLSYRDRLFIQPFYQYHFLDYRAQRHEAQFVFDYTNGSPPVPTEWLVKFVSQGDDARGQLGGLDLYYQPLRHHWRVGLKGTYLEFESKETHTKTKVKEVALNTNPPVNTYTSPKFHEHGDWQSFTIAGYVGYTF